LHPLRIQEITQYILNNFRQKTHRTFPGAKGFNAMLAVSSVDAAKAYYTTFKMLQEEAEKKSGSYKRLRVATIFSFAANEEQSAIGDITDESFDTSAMNSSAKEFLDSAIDDYNNHFKTNFSTDSNGFQNYYRDLAQRVKNQDIDLLIVVGMFLTGFDAPTLNTLFVDKNLRYHGLMQAFSRTNRIYDATKTFGNIVTFRDLERPTIDAITLFGDKNTKNVVLEKATKSTCRALAMRQPAKLNEVLCLLFRSWSSASLTLPVSTVKKRKKPSSNCLVNICGQKTSCKTTMNLPR
jgi:type I restriction enzyme R subunit